MSERVRRALGLLSSQDRAVRRKLQAAAIAARYHADQKAIGNLLDEITREMTPQELGVFQATRMADRWRNK